MTSSPLAHPPTVLFVHAHPDDESITTGGTMASLAARGARVVLLSATRGEGGEVIGDEFAHLAGDRTGLAAHREGELVKALQALGIREHLFLGQPVSGLGQGQGLAHDQLPARQFTDSGMEWGPDGHAQAPAQLPADALCAADIDTVADYIAQVLGALQPDAVVTYSEGGGYGHPDHVAMHHASVAAVKRIAEHERPLLLYIDTPAEVAQAAFDPTQPGFDLSGFSAATQIPSVPPTRDIAIAQDVSAWLGTKTMAMSAHTTQVTVAGPFFALSNSVGQAIGETEYFTTDATLPHVPYTDITEAIGDFMAQRAPVAPYSNAHATQAAIPPQSGTVLADEHPEYAPVAKPDEKPKLGLGAIVHAVLIAFLMCVLGTFQHLNAFALDLAGQMVVVPWGLVLALAMTAAGLWHIASMYRSTSLMVLTGVIVSMGAFALGQSEILPGNDLLIVNNIRSLVWLFTPMVLAGILAFSLPALKVRSSQRKAHE